MKIYIVGTVGKQSQAYRRMVSFLTERGHEILNMDSMSGKAPEVSDEAYFENSLQKAKQAEILVSMCNQSEPAEIGFWLSYSTSKGPRFILFCRPLEADILPAFIKGCTFKNFFLRHYQTWEDIERILTLFKL